MMTLIYTVGN